MKNKGFIALYRDIFDWEWFDDVYVFKLFVCLIMLANHKTKKHKGVQIKKGSLVTSVKVLSEKTKLSETSVKNSLKKLISTGDIIEEIKPNKHRIITIKNYNKYQSVGFSKTDNKTDSKTDNKTDKRQSVGFSKTTNNKYKNPTDSYTEQTAPPRALEERTAAAVTLMDVRKFQLDNRVGSGEDAQTFYEAFRRSGTRLPADWQQVYTGYIKADMMAQIAFIERLESGGYRDKWGAADAGA